LFYYFFTFITFIDKKCNFIKMLFLGLNIVECGLMENLYHTVEITGYSAEGAGVAKLADGRVVFVKEAARGDVCCVKIVKENKNSCEAIIENISEPSKHRIMPDCPGFGKCGGCGGINGYSGLGRFNGCGGCVWRHVSYEEELSAKRTRVKDALERIGGLSGIDDKLEETVLTAGKINGYRNRAQFSVALREGTAVTGFYMPGSHEVAAVDECLLVDPGANGAVRCVRDWINKYKIPVYNQSSMAGIIRRIYTRTGVSGLTVCLSINGTDIPHTDELLESLRSNSGILSGILSGMLISFSRGRDNRFSNNQDDGVPGELFETLWGSGDIDVPIGDLTLRMSPASFGQVNDDGALLLYSKAKEYAALAHTDFLLDLYCGAGAITLYLGRSAGSALGVEVSAPAVEDAKRNAKRNGISNIEFIRADASRLDTRGLRPDCVTVDPPRKGLSREAINKIIGLSPPRVVYISCDPSTLARDVKLFDGYSLRKACVVDMFPRTASIECVALLTRGIV
jgi:23S rRNA (uracil1939-C5)-methyltransferase